MSVCGFLMIMVFSCLLLVVVGVAVALCLPKLIVEHLDCGDDRYPD